MEIDQGRLKQPRTSEETAAEIARVNKEWLADQAAAEAALIVARGAVWDRTRRAEELLRSLGLDVRIDSAWSRGDGASVFIAYHGEVVLDEPGDVELDTSRDPNP